MVRGKNVHCCHLRRNNILFFSLSPPLFSFLLICLSNSPSLSLSLKNSPAHTHTQSHTHTHTHRVSVVSAQLSFICASCFIDVPSQREIYSLSLYLSLSLSSLSLSFSCAVKSTHVCWPASQLRFRGWFLFHIWELQTCSSTLTSHM